MTSGKFVLRIEPELHLALKTEAHRLGESLNTLCQHKLSAAAPIIETNGLPLNQIITSFCPVGVVLFGSTVRGEATSKSDIDLLIVLDSKKMISRDFYRHWDKLHFKDSISPQFVHLPRIKEPLGSLWLECAIEGEILYDPNKSLRVCFREIRQSIAEGSYTKKISHGQSYWIRQEPNAK